MSLGGTGIAGLNQANKKPTKKCERCGLRYPEDEDVCIHCGNLNEHELLALKEKTENEHTAHLYLGRIFLAIALIISALLLLSYLN